MVARVVADARRARMSRVVDQKSGTEAGSVALAAEEGCATTLRQG